MLAAHRAGIKIVFLPERNRKDMADVPDEVSRELDVRFVTRIGEALDVALARGETVPLASDSTPAVVPRVQPPEAPSRRNAAS